MKSKILKFAVLPLLLALCAIALTVRHHANSLAQQEKEVIEKAFLDAKDAELKNYVTIAQRAIAHLYDSGKSDEATKAEAREILRKLEYSIDGYFFAYNLDGKQIFHSKQRELEETNMWGIEDCAGNLIIQELIRVARTEGFVDYKWPKYSLISRNSQPKYAGQDSELDCEYSRPKRAYVIELPHWGWMLGTGVYLDDVDSALSEIDAQVSRNINNTMLWIAGIAFMCAVAIFFGLMRNIRERTTLDDKLGLANAELKALAQRVINARDEERERIERDLHDGVKPFLVAVKLKIQTGIGQLPTASGEIVAAQNTFKSASDLLKESLLELTNIIRGIQSSTSLNLAQLLKKITLDMKHPALEIAFNVEGETRGLTSDAEQVLSLVTREALTNTISYSSAKHARVLLSGTTDFVKLEICDDGQGFDVDFVVRNPKQSTGLRNMRKRVEQAGGKHEVISSSNGTCVIVTIPLSDTTTSHHD
jgi:two-component system NarL family sensor kinase